MIMLKKLTGKGFECIHSYNSHSWIRKQASLAFTCYGGGTEGRRKTKSAYGWRKEEETFKRAILGRSHFRSKESVHFIILDLSEHGEQKRGGKYNLNGFAFVFVNHCRAHLLSLLRRKEGALRIGILRVPLEFPHFFLRRKEGALILKLRISFSC